MLNQNSLKIISFIVLSTISTLCTGQKEFGTSYLPLKKCIPLPDVRGRIDHMAIDTVNAKVYMAALGNNTVEVIDLKAEDVQQSIKNVDEPQGIIYLPELKQILVSSGATGQCTFFETDHFTKVHEVKLSGDADNIRFDRQSGKIYVGFGRGGLAAIDARSGQLTGTVMLSGHPESFQMDLDAGKVWVNIPGNREIAVVQTDNLKTVDHWNLGQYRGNFPMAYDQQHSRLFVGCRQPSRLIVLNSQTGKQIGDWHTVGDADDIFYDKTTGLIFVSGGMGYIDIFKQNDADHYQQLAHISTRAGARTCLWIPEWRQLLLAVPANTIEAAELCIYELKL